MYKNYKISLVPYFFLENVSVIFWTNKKLTNSHSLLYIPHKWHYLFTIINKNELTLSSNILIENSAVDTISYKQWPFKIKKYLNNLLVFYTYYYFNAKNKLTVFTTNTELNNNSYVSIDKIYNNANWIERETSEMYNILYYFKNDTRRLLLDYSKVENPLMKNYPSAGYVELFYNVFENQVSVNTVEMIDF